MVQQNRVRKVLVTTWLREGAMKMFLATTKLGKDVMEEVKE